MMSHCCQPSASISAREVGRKAAGEEPAARTLVLENKGVALCTPGIRSDCAALVQQIRSPQVDGNIDLIVLALNQQRDVAPGPGYFAFQIGHGGHPSPIHAQYDVAS